MGRVPRNTSLGIPRTPGYSGNIIGEREQLSPTLSFSRVATGLASSDLHMSKTLPGYLQSVRPDGSLGTNFLQSFPPNPLSQVKGKGQVPLRRG